MNRREFINGLREALELKMGKTEIESQLDYYNDYIKSEVKSGRNEKEVVEELGDPWAIARNLGYEADTEYEEQKKAETVKNSAFSGNKFYISESKWIIIGILVAIVAILFIILSFTMSMISLFYPILLPIFLIMFVVRMFKR